MPSELAEVLSYDHERLDALLADSIAPDGSVVASSYDQFRRGLLRHIGIEETILFPLLRQHQSHANVQRQLHRDHAALAALLVPPPTAAVIEQIRTILRLHNPLEEGSEGMYELAAELAGRELPALLAKVRAFPEVRTAPHADSPIVWRSIEQLVREAEEGRKANDSDER